MVNRVIELFADVAANDTDAELGRASPREGKVYNVEEVFFRSESEGEFTVELDERALIQDLDTQTAPGVSERLVVNWTVRSGEDLVALGTDESGGQNEMATVLVVDEVDAGGA